MGGIKILYQSHLAEKRNEEKRFLESPWTLLNIF